ncbi:DUF1634 domain-containing protein [Bordetella petrii]|uniref:DUF1634 domain-containing protein n=1 Tax=Bordetella petrii TaxID=94624 RepID=UPI001A96A3B2|nr:DUF1634 domain-containing protein [Bordetella petrii]MBO1114221.1 DUF1634 domain-containing protein [Bordetella petrii]
MTAPAPRRHEQRIAMLLHYGTWFASALIGIGLLAQWLWQTPPAGLAAVQAGIAMFIALPVLRVALMLALFLRERDRLYSGLALAVLAIIGAGLAAGLMA